MCSERQMRTIDEKKCIEMKDFDCVYCGEVFETTAKDQIYQFLKLFLKTQIFICNDKNP